MNIISAARDKKLFGRWFKDPSWQSWMVFLKSLFAIPLEDGEQEIFTKHTGRSVLPANPLREAWLVVGRRGGKSLIAAFVALYLACFRDYSKYLAPGELGTLMLIAADRRQARVVMRYILGFIENTPLLKSMIVRRTRESIELSNKIMIEIHTCSFRSTRGYSLIGVVADEIAFWRSDESANPDVEILNALRPGLATMPGSMLLAISSPYARRGALWEAHQKHYGKENDPVLIWQADTRSMNPNVPQEIINEALEADEPSAKAEYLAIFRSDSELYASRESLEAVKIPHRVELPYSKQFEYFAFVDPSGGQADSMTMAIAHSENGCTVLDLMREAKPPFSPDNVVSNFALQLQAYKISCVTGDRYGGQWPQERFRHHRIEYKISSLTKSEIYRSMLPVINSGKVELLDDTKLFNQFLQLERRTGSAGREFVDHPPGGHDDVANAVAGACLLASGFGGPSGGARKLRGF